MSADARARLDQCVDTIESAYEYFLAYAAQGRRTDLDGDSTTSELRGHLESIIAAMGELDTLARGCAASARIAVPDSAARFFDAIAEDSAIAAGACALVLSRGAISSQLIDNLNASVHLRALLTDLFVVDEALRGS